MIIGLSWRGNPAENGVGGTCQERARLLKLKNKVGYFGFYHLRYSVDGKTYSFNCLFITMRSKQQHRISLKMAILNLVHELMHAFGKL